MAVGDRGPCGGEATAAADVARAVARGDQAVLEPRAENATQFSSLVTLQKKTSSHYSI